MDFKELTEQEKLKKNYTKVSIEKYYQFRCNMQPIRNL